MSGHMRVGVSGSGAAVGGPTGVTNTGGGRGQGVGGDLRP